MAQRFFLPSSLRDKSLSAALYQRIVDAYHSHFGPDFAGWAFMILFVGELSDFRKILAQAPVTPTAVPLASPSSQLGVEPDPKAKAAKGSGAGAGRKRARVAVKLEVEEGEERAKERGLNEAGGVAACPRARTAAATLVAPSSSRHFELDLKAEGEAAGPGGVSKEGLSARERRSQRRTWLRGPQGGSVAPC
mmetsp:Transcript_18797/g.43746  ORF Transcript_18797/g.43746 Transcript_18797/m.43746 type:complete len:192 (+) Transcript_18797:89-664(+)|eukprot:CAMPEP_0182567292 /NCGR_PEP_ID=MMETSP1324-20130603/8548_1 /TAXON_ID=236786 /ORGANISM="Florenciella sp., Strain RCC1587" /LENGTH=191 /DNA_ID=CAMNT_0024781261 /DNA_START=87 /DNA_END=662 /DNA_ORIENTATION=-